MSDDMLHAILQMPPDLWSDREIWQRHGRYCEASKRITELERERDEARRELAEAISKLKFAQNELFTILRFQEDEKREHRNLLERLSFFQNRFESMRAERDQAMSDLYELREEQKEEA